MNRLSFSKDDLVPLIRQSYDIGLFGKKGSFKSAIASLLCFLHLKVNKAIVFSNISLNFPHIRVRNLDDLRRVFDYDPFVPKVFFGDDFTRWFDTQKNKANVTMSLIMLDMGKANCSTIYTEKRSMKVNIDLRDGTCEYWFPSPYLAYRTFNMKIDNILKNYLNFINVNIVRYNEDLDEINPVNIERLEKVCKLYNTLEKVESPFKTINQFDLNNRDGFQGNREVSLIPVDS